MSRTYYVYILSSRSRTLYTGVTNNLQRRIAEHRSGVAPGFTSKYKISRLVHFEMFADIRNAIMREKQIKKWRREEKNRIDREPQPRLDRSRSGNADAAKEMSFTKA
jgi:putative endonuclease